MKKWSLIKTSFKNHSQRIKNNRKQILINYAIFLAIILVLVLIDQLTKTFLFKWHRYLETGEYTVDSSKFQDFGIIGIRSVEHFGATVIKSKTVVVVSLIQVLSVVIFLILICSPLFTNKKFWLVIIAIILSGDIGNMLDRFIFQGIVKDILYFPFIEKMIGRPLATFNVADVYIAIGCVIMIIIFIVALFQKDEEEITSKKHNIINLQDSLKLFIGDIANNTVLNKNKSVEKFKYLKENKNYLTLVFNKSFNFKFFYLRDENANLTTSFNEICDKFLKYENDLKECKLESSFEWISSIFFTKLAILKEHPDIKINKGLLNKLKKSKNIEDFYLIAQQLDNDLWIKINNIDLVEYWLNLSFDFYINEYPNKVEGSYDDRKENQYWFIKFKNNLIINDQRLLTNCVENLTSKCKLLNKLI